MPSLVGSEMCIRDRIGKEENKKNKTKKKRKIKVDIGNKQRVGRRAVSYTHLTLPTICSVQISVVAVSLKKKKKTMRVESEVIVETYIQKCGHELMGGQLHT
eukprot:TRINITY_DN6305_c0_g1_i7.p3 TRINITY_DN6305_c0_g1~~TRINITY_DN6305_c0_g1_i7.p3  ORF type:complete len:102 (+),score=23.47 TRINITY_DN6305_c0_g1_i7:115-420(+)